MVINTMESIISQTIGRKILNKEIHKLLMQSTPEEAKLTERKIKLEKIKGTKIIPTKTASQEVKEGEEFLRELKSHHKRKINWAKYFDYVIISLIIVSSLMLILDNPLNDPDSKSSKVLGNIDYVFTCLFAIEAMIKIIGLGFFYSSVQQYGYILIGWNILDFIVV